MKISKLIILAFIVCFLLVFLDSGSVQGEEPVKDDGIIAKNSEDEGVKIGVEREIIQTNLDFWCAYWDYDRGLYEMGNLDAFMQVYDLSPDIQFTKADMFALDFNSDISLHFSDKVELNSFETDQKKYITIVNDVLEADGNYIHKDSEIITEIMLSDKKRKKHMDDILRFMTSNDFDGVTLDYERVEEQTWDAYATFIDELGQLLKKNGYGLRVVLETKCPVEEVDFPQEYQYIIMCYNLYGSHSGPGPKADYAYIEQTCNRLKDNFDNYAIAFSLGGFDWCDDEIKALTLTQAQEIIEAYQIETRIDKQSGAVYFEYQENGTNHIVWYCDGHTLNRWIDAAKSSGVDNISIWRLGGNLIVEEKYEND